jgi:hypothetical protein
MFVNRRFLHVFLFRIHNQKITRERDEKTGKKNQILVLLTKKSSTHPS